MKLDDLDQTFRPLGKHLVCLDGDILWLRSGGAVELAEQLVMAELAYSLYDRHGYILVLADATRAKPPSPETRRFHAEQLKKRVNPSHTALYGTSALVRGVATLGMRAAEIITGKVTPITFHPDEASARAMLAAQRVILSRKPG